MFGIQPVSGKNYEYLPIPYQYGEYGAGSHAERVVQIAYDAERRDARQSCGYQHLCAVRDNALNETGECIQYACRFPAVR